MSHHTADSTLPSPIRKLCFECINSGNAIPHDQARWTSTDAVGGWVRLEQIEPDLLLSTTGLQLSIAEMFTLTVVSLLLPHLFPSPSDFNIVIIDRRARVYEANAEIQLLVADIAFIRSWSRALAFVKHEDDDGPRRC